MKRSAVACVFAALALLANVALARADQFGTAEEGHAMLDHAVAAVKADNTKALKKFNDKNDKEFHEKDLYVYCFNLKNGEFTAYQSSVMLGVDVRELKMQEDPIGQRAYDLVHDAPEGDVRSMEYNFPKPGTKKLVPKETIEARIGDQACGVTYFK
jgi:cytochrome c